MRMAGESRMNMAITGSVGGGGGHVSLLVATVADLLEMHIQSGHLPDSAEFSNLCLSLARFYLLSLPLCVHMYFLRSSILV